MSAWLLERLKKGSVKITEARYGNDPILMMIGYGNIKQNIIKKDGTFFNREKNIPICVWHALKEVGHKWVNGDYNG